jgi:tRNA pseudouridine55 synthase
MDGILLINKPVNLTSHDVVQILRKKLNTKKIGHAGTLDPFADGLLVIGIGRGTKCLQFLEAASKEYVAILKLGVKTNSGDPEGKIIETQDVSGISNEKIKEVLTTFLGDSYQLPPMYSALKVNGEKLYNLARQGIEIEREKRLITISDINLISYDEISHEVIFQVVCSKGTYIRTLGEDIATRLGTIGYLTNLRRTRIGSFTLMDATLIDDVHSEMELISNYQALSFMPQYQVNEKEEAKVIYGQKLKINLDVPQVLIINSKYDVLAVYEQIAPNTYKSLRGLFS